jgi:hypothetical protein
MGGACSTYGERGGLCKVLVGKPEGKNHLEDVGTDGRIILKWIFSKWDRDMDCIDVAQDRDRWHALVTAIKKISGSIKCVEFLD